MSRTLRLVHTAAIVLAMAAGATTLAQCVDHSQGKTAVRLNNEGSFDLTFFVDHNENGIAVPSRTVSIEVEVAPGEHLLRARAVVQGHILWFWALNQVRKGEICTWTATDPQGTRNMDDF